VRGHDAGHDREPEARARATASAPCAPEGTVLRTESDAGGTYEAHVRKSDGTEVEVKLDRQFKVTGVEQHDRR